MKSKHINVPWRAVNRSLSVSPLTLCVFFPPLHTPSPIHTPPTLHCADCETFLWLLLDCSSCSFSVQNKKGPAVLVSGLGRSSTDEVLGLSGDNRPRALQQHGARPNTRPSLKKALFQSAAQSGVRTAMPFPHASHPGLLTWHCLLFKQANVAALKGRHKDTLPRRSLSNINRKKLY